MANNILGTLLLLIKTKGDTAGLDKTDKAVKKTTQSLQKMSKSTGFLGKLSGKLFDGFKSFDYVGAGLKYLDFEKKLGAIHSRFYAITGDAKLANAEFEYARKISHETAMSLMDVADSYSIFYASASRTLGSQGAKEVYENWTKVARVLHISGEQYKSIMYAQREMSSKGRLYAQDLLIQMGTHVPDIKNIATTAIKRLNIPGITSIEDFQAYTKSKKGDDIMGRFLLEMSREAKKRYASDEALRNALQMPDALVNRLQIIGQDFLVAFSQKGGAVLVVKILESIVGILESINYDAITSVMGDLAKGIASILGFVTNNLTSVLSVLKGILIAIVAGKVWSMAGKVGSLATGAWFATKQGKFLPWLLMKFGYKNLIGVITKGAVQGATKMGLKALLGVGLNFIPMIGQILSVALWIWSAVDILKPMFNMLSNKLDKSKSDLLSHPFADSGKTGAQLLNILRAVSNKQGINDNLALANAVRGYGGADVVQYFDYNDNGTITVHIDGADYTADELAQKIQQEINKGKEDKKKSIFGSKPSAKNPFENKFFK